MQSEKNSKHGAPDSPGKKEINLRKKKGTACQVCQDREGKRKKTPVTDRFARERMFQPNAKEKRASHKEKGKESS